MLRPCYRSSCSVCFHLRCPIEAGITGRRDVLYNLPRSQADKEKYPQIEVVPELATSTIRQQRAFPIASSRSGYWCSTPSKPRRQFAPNTAIIIITAAAGVSAVPSITLAQHLADWDMFVSRPNTDCLLQKPCFPAGVYDIKATDPLGTIPGGFMELFHFKIAALGIFSEGGELAAFMGTTAICPFEGKAVPSFLLMSMVIDIDGTLSFVHPACEGR